jgi:hypothetical protein
MIIMTLNNYKEIATNQMSANSKRPVDFQPSIDDVVHNLKKLYDILMGRYVTNVENYVE